MSKLLAPLVLRNLTPENRIMVSPMNQYSAAGGNTGDWHLIHLGQTADLYRSAGEPVRFPVEAGTLLSAPISPACNRMSGRSIEGPLRT